MKSKKEIILETASAYTTENRAFDKHGCLYLTSDGRKCGVGRVMTDEAAECFREEKGEGLNMYSLEYTCEARNFDYGNLFKEEYRGHELVFWSEIQALHDNKLYWNEKGLSPRGETQVSYLLSVWQNK